MTRPGAMSFPPLNVVPCHSPPLNLQNLRGFFVVRSGRTTDTTLVAYPPQPKRSGHPPQSKFLGLLKECLMGILVKTAFRPHLSPTKSSKNVGLYSKTHMVDFPCSEPYKTCRILIILEPKTQNGSRSDQKSIRFLTQS